MMRKDVLVYISGPMTARAGFTVEENIAAGLKIYIDCLQNGIPAFSPHLSGIFPSAWNAIEYDEWLEYDKRIIDRCTHMLLMPRWAESVGAKIEQAYAIEIGIKIINSIGEIEDANK